MISKTLVSTVAAAACALIVGLSATAWTADPPPPLQETKPAPAPVVKASSKDRAELNRNLASILLALHNYHAANGRFPAAAIRSADGRPLLSWRVAILPYMVGQAGLYRELRLDEPWDSPHNQKLIALMPPAFQTPGHPAPAGETRIRGVESPGAMFGPPFRGARTDLRGGAFILDGGAKAQMTADAKAGAPARREEAEAAIQKAEARPDGGLMFDDVTDGPSNTAFLVVAEDAVEWTRPGELDVPGGLAGGGGDLPALVDDAEGYILGMVDGSTRRLPFRGPGGREIVLRALLTYAGGEIPSSVIFEPVPAPPPSGTADMEGRLRRVEEKIDAILERLDAMAPKP